LGGAGKGLWRVWIATGRFLHRKVVLGSLGTLLGWGVEHRKTFFEHRKARFFYKHRKTRKNTKSFFLSIAWRKMRKLKCASLFLWVFDCENLRKGRKFAKIVSCFARNLVGVGVGTSKGFIFLNIERHEKHECFFLSVAWRNTRKGNALRCFFCFLNIERHEKARIFFLLRCFFGG